MSANLQPRDFFRVVFRHKRKVMVYIATVMLTAWVALVFWPRSYESVAKLMIRVGRESVSLDPTATTSETIMLQKSQEEEINSALDVLSSRHLAEKVVDNLGPSHALIEEDTRSGYPAVQRAAVVLGDVFKWCLTTAGVRDDISDRELAVRDLLQELSIYAPKNSSVITIAYRGKSPKIAQETVAEVFDVYQGEHLRVSRTPGSREFFDRQSAQLTTSLQDKIEELDAFRKRHGIVSMSTNQELLKDQLLGVESELRAAHVLYEKSNAEISVLKTRIARLEPELVSAKVGKVDPTWSAMRQRIFELEIQENELASKYTNIHPLLQHVRQQLATVRENFDEDAENRVDVTTTPNPIVQGLTQKLLILEAEAAGVQTAIKSLLERKQEVFAKLDGLIEVESQLRQLDREVSILEINYRNLQKKLEEARIIDALQEKKISNVNVVQPATFVERPVSPHKRVIAAVALFVAVFGGVGLAFTAEAMDTTLRTTEQAESQLNLPVLSSIPAIVHPRDLLQILSNTASTDALDVNCKSLLQQVLCAREQHEDASTILGVLSVNAGSGGSTLAARLAILASQDLGLSTLLVDTDNEEDFVSQAFRLNGSPGLRELMANEAPETECIQHLGVPNLSIISSAAQDAPGALTLDPRDVAGRLNRLRSQYELVIVDMPPASVSSAGVLLASMLDHVLLVVQSEKTVGSAAKRVLDQLVRSHARLSGVVLNKTREHLPRWLRGMV